MKTNTIDIRDPESFGVDQIIFSDESSTSYNCAALGLGQDLAGKFVFIASDHSKMPGRVIGLKDKSQALNLISAVQKAIQLGWFD